MSGIPGSRNSFLNFSSQNWWARVPSRAASEGSCGNRSLRRADGGQLSHCFELEADRTAWALSTAVIIWQPPARASARQERDTVLWGPASGKRPRTAPEPASPGAASPDPPGRSWPPRSGPGYKPGGTLWWGAGLPRASSPQRRSRKPAIRRPPIRSVKQTPVWAEASVWAETPVWIAAPVRTEASASPQVLWTPLARLREDRSAASAAASSARLPLRPRYWLSHHGPPMPGPGCWALPWSDPIH